MRFVSAYENIDIGIEEGTTLDRFSPEVSFRLIDEKMHRSESAVNCRVHQRAHDRQ